MAAKRRAPAKSVSRTPQQAIWDCIRTRAQDFSVREIFRAGAQEESDVAYYVRALVRAGFIAVTRRQRGPEQPRYRLTNDIGVEAPRVTKSGRVVRHSIVELCWQTMRRLKEFTAYDLSVVASIEECRVTPHFARNYCALLVRAGYLDLVKAPIGGPGGIRASYRLRRNTGPLPPAERVTRRRALFDPNLDRTVWNEEMAA